LDFRVFNTMGSAIFDMIFATDHWAGEKIMTELYSKALSRQPGLQKMAQLQRRQEKLESEGVFGLFDMADLAPESPGFEVRHQPIPPRPPYRLPHA
jgi:hypothetical protein